MIELKRAFVTEVVSPAGNNGAKPMLDAVVDTELAVDRLELEEVLADLVLLEAHCLIE